jgi:hypothetical protein
MSAFTRLYYATRGFDDPGTDDCDADPFEDAFQEPPVSLVSPEDPYGEAQIVPHGDRREPAPDMPGPQLDPRRLYEAMRMRVPT